jgi:hypothetical protein
LIYLCVWRPGKCAVIYLCVWRPGKCAVIYLCVWRPGKCAPVVFASAEWFYIILADDRFMTLTGYVPKSSSHSLE